MHGLLLFGLLLTSSDPPADQVVHDAAIRRAHVREEPVTRIEDIRLDRNLEDSKGFTPDEVVTCRFLPGGASGSTPKFECELSDGDHVKVKYGRGNPEVYAEVAATRLLAALGFPTDRMYVVKSVRCAGCPVDPFPQLECANRVPANKAIETCFPSLDFSRFQEFKDAVIERPLKGRRIEGPDLRGWSWEELKYVDPVVGGATRAELDALRLLAIFLGHWDNKASNQRLMCRDETPHDEGCARPLAMVQDLGATFGPLKLDLRKWSQTKIWADGATCKVSMRHLPYGGSTFPDAYISEEGRKLLGGLLRRLSTAQIRALFEGARFERYPHRQLSARRVDNWVRAFQAKVRAINDHGRCPSDPTPVATQSIPSSRE